MRKFIFGMIAVLAVHIAFVAFFATLDTVESNRNAKSLATPTAIPAAAEPARSDEIVIARGITVESPTQTSVTDTRSDPKPAAIPSVERRKANKTPRPAKTVNAQPKGTVAVYQTAGWSVQRTQFPAVQTFAAADQDRNTFTAKTKKASRTGNRSFLAKVGSIIKKPYDGLKAVASWLR